MFPKSFLVEKFDTELNKNVICVYRNYNHLIKEMILKTLEKDTR